MSGPVPERPGLAAMLQAKLIPPQRTALDPVREVAFRRWYQTWATEAGLDPDPDNPLHRYDYRGAFLADERPRVSPVDGRYHWSSKFKDAEHPNRFVDGVDTRAQDRKEP